MTRLWPVRAAVRALLTAALAGMLLFTPASSKDQGIGGTGARVVNSTPPAVLSAAVRYGAR